MKILRTFVIFLIAAMVPAVVLAFPGQAGRSGTHGTMKLFEVSVHTDTIPEFSASPTHLSFGNLLVTSMHTDTVTVTNPGGGPLTISSVTSTNAVFSVDPTSGVVPPAGEKLFFVTFAPVSTGFAAGEIMFEHDAASSPDTVTVDGTGTTLKPPVISGVSRSARVPLAGDSVVVSATITDSSGLGIGSAALLYTMNGATTASAAMSLVSGTNESGTWSGVIPGSANTDGARIEYQITATSNNGAGDTTAVIYSSSYFAGTSLLSQSGVRAMNGSGKILYGGYYARVSGTVNAPNDQTSNYSYYIQDAAGGINVFAFGSLDPVLTYRDSVTVLGRLDQFRGKTEITPDNLATDITVVDTGKSVAVATLTVADFQANPEPYESMIIQFQGISRRDPNPAWPALGGSANIVMYQGTLTDTIILRIDSDYEIDGSPEPTYPISVTGLATQFTTSGSLYNNGYQIQPRFLSDITPFVGVDQGSGIPKVFALAQNYPNPFNPLTKIRFDVPREANVELIVYDLLGREVSHLVQGSRHAGSYVAEFDGRNLASGVYFYRMIATPAGETSPAFVQTHKLMIAK